MFHYGIFTTVYGICDYICFKHQHPLLSSSHSHDPSSYHGALLCFPAFACSLIVWLVFLKEVN